MKRGIILTGFAMLVFGVALLQAQSIVVEGEDAVSTNFAAEPVQLFGAGQNLTLQLNQTTLLNDAPYYADFVVFADSPGEFAVWYGGSIPGAADAFAPSYGSPFTLTLNDADPIEVTWETVRTGPVYSTPYRWIHIGTMHLEQGQNRLRVSVDQRRRYDSRFFLYLDRFVFVPVDSADPLVPDESLLSDEPESIEDLLIVLRDHPEDLHAYIRLAHLYTLVGDHINALRFLNRALLLDARNPAVLQLIARNTIWRGDLDGGLAAYWSLLSAVPNDLNGFLEAGKIAAWNGFLGASVEFYNAAFAYFPNEVRLLVNLGFTNLWWNREARARELFQQAERAATTVEDVLLIGAEYRLNEDFAREEELYRTARRRFPESLRIAQQLVEVLYAQRKDEAARDTQTQLLAELPDTAAATAAFERIARRYALRDAVIEGYEAQVASDPDNPVLRSELAQTYFWIGRREAGIRAFENLLALQTQQALRKTWDEVESSAWRAVLASFARTVLRTNLNATTADGAALATALQQYARLSAREGQDLGALQQRIMQLTASIERLLESTDLAVSLYQRSVAPHVDETRAFVEARTADMAAIREQIGWNAPLVRLSDELSAADDVPEAELTRWVVRALWVAASEAGLPASLPQSVGVEGRGETALLLALLSRAHGTQTAWDAWSAIESVEPGNEALQDLLLFSELLGGALGAGTAQTELPPLAFNEELAKAAQAALSERQTDIVLALRSMEEHGSLFIEAARAATEPALFYLQTATASQRNRLGQLYIDNNQITAAIAQLELVRAVDPNNLDSLYSLAQAYERQGRWRQAKSTYAEIYAFDAAFRNAVALHNQLARRYADTFTASTSVVAERERNDVRASLTYLWRAGSRFGVQGKLDSGVTRLRVPDAGQVRRTSIQFQQLTVGLPVQFLGERMTLEPLIGARIVGNQLHFATPSDASVIDATDAGDFFQNYRAEPLLGVTWRLTGRETFFDTRYLYGPYVPAEDHLMQTVLLERPRFLAHQLNANVALDFSQRTDPLIARLAQRTGVSAQLVQQNASIVGARYSLEQEVRVSVLRRDQPFTRLGVSPLFVFEDYASFDDSGSERSWYYRPDTVVQAGARFDWQLYRGISSEMSWGTSGNLYGGYYQSEVGGGASDPRLRLAADLAGEITRNNVAFQIGLSGSRVFDFDDATDDYYNLGLTFTVVARNFALLAR